MAGTDADAEEGLRLLIERAAHGEAVAQNTFGTRYEQGIGVVQDRPRRCGSTLRRPIRAMQRRSATSATVT